MVPAEAADDNFGCNRAVCLPAVPEESSASGAAADNSSAVGDSSAVPDCYMDKDIPD